MRHCLLWCPASADDAIHVVVETPHQLWAPTLLVSSQSLPSPGDHYHTCLHREAFLWLCGSQRGLPVLQQNFAMFE